MQLHNLEVALSTIQSSVDSRSNSNSTFTGTTVLAGLVEFQSTVSGLAKGMVGLGNVDNTADADKPILMPRRPRTWP